MGAVNVNSQLDVGSIFTVTIDTGPLDGVAMIVPNHAELAIATEEEEHLAISLPNMRVLLVDDGEENRQLMSLILEEAGATSRPRRMDYKLFNWRANRNGT